MKFIKLVMLIVLIFILWNGSAEAIILRFEPDSTETNVGQLDTLYIYLQHDDVMFYSLNIQFDPDRLVCTNVLDYGLLPGLGDFNYDNEAGRIIVNRTKLGADGIPIDDYIVRLIFRVVSPGNTIVEFLPATTIGGSYGIPVEFDPTISTAQITGIFTGALPDIEFNEDEQDTLILNQYVANPDSQFQWDVMGMINIQAVIVDTIVVFSAAEHWYGQETLIFTLSDSSGYEGQDTIQVMVSAVNDLPVVDLPNLTFAEDSTTTLNLNLHVVDVEDSVQYLQWNYVTPDTHLVVEIDSMNILHLSAGAHYFNENIPLILTATDTENGSTTDTTLVTITPVPDSIGDFHRLLPENGRFMRRDSVRFVWTTAPHIPNEIITYTLTISSDSFNREYSTLDTTYLIDFGQIELPEDSLNVYWSVTATNGGYTGNLIEGEGLIILNLIYDVNYDRQFNLLDIQEAIRLIGMATNDPRYDFNDDGLINIDDARQIMLFWFANHPF